MLNTEDTIVAIASPTSPSVRGIIRLSGENATAVVDRICGTREDSRDRCQKERLNAGRDFEWIDADVLRWPNSQSYTGQPSVEIHTHGSLPLLNALVKSLMNVGARAAKPGEFTMRAFLAGRLDLTQAEAVLGVIDAEQRGALDHALRQLAGNLSKPLESLRDNLLNLLADVEAGLDFVDEDIEFVSQQELDERLKVIEVELQQTSQRLSVRHELSERRNIVFFGSPNVGKSRLVNAIANQEVALVANLAGTTRDAVTMDIDLQGLSVRLVDTAGVDGKLNRDDGRQKRDDDGQSQDDPFDDLDALAQRSSEAAVQTADIGLFCHSLPDYEQVDRERWSGFARRSAQIIQVGTKVDQVSPQARSRFPSGMILTSSVTGEGINELRAAILSRIQEQDREQTGSVLGTAARCEESLRQALASIRSARRHVELETGSEFVADELRLTARSIGEVTGAVYTDDVLDRVFGRFCIGK